MQNHSVLVTGAYGFIGEHLCAILKKKNLAHTKCVRSAKDPADFSCGDLTKFQSWESLFQGITSVVHLAAKVHDFSDVNVDEYLQTNTYLTLKIAEEAKKNGVKQFVFLSTIKVNGSKSETPFTADMTPTPTGPYAITKYKAEIGLMKLHQPGIFDVVIIRPTLIYGPKVKANFQSLISLVKKKIPLPFGCVHNKRSFTYIGNLTDFIITCIQNKKSGGNVFLVSDGIDLSLKELIKLIAYSLKISVFLIPVPVFFLKFVLFLFKKNELSDRLFSNLQVNIDKNLKLLAWSPPYNLKESFAETLANNSRPAS